MTLTNASHSSSINIEATPSYRYKSVQLCTTQCNSVQTYTTRENSVKPCTCLYMLVQACATLYRVLQIVQAYSPYVNLFMFLQWLDSHLLQHHPREAGVFSFVDHSLIRSLQLLESSGANITLVGGTQNTFLMVILNLDSGVQMQYEILISRPKPACNSNELSEWYFSPPPHTSNSLVLGRAGVHALHPVGKPRL